LRRASPCEPCCFSQSEENCTAIRLPRIWYEMRFIPVARFLSLSLFLSSFLALCGWSLSLDHIYIYLPTTRHLALYSCHLLFCHISEARRKESCIPGILDAFVTWNFQERRRTPIPISLSRWNVYVWLRMWICVRVGVTLSPNAKCELVVEPSKANCCIIPEARSQPLPT